MTVYFHTEKFDECIGEGRALLEKNCGEIYGTDDGLTFNMDDALYRAIEAKGKLSILTARDDGKLVGYSSMLISNHGHFKHLVAGVDDVHFLDPAYRNGMTGVRLIRQMESTMRERGCHFMTVRTNSQHNHGAIFERLGFRDFERVWFKRLDRD